ncbi:MAG: PAS domain-containing protein [Candidatus Latescibacteria bacterium]|nr:PAS domain-containing protein [bacterium]MBD3424781.1 PAS domain-containing protein [Candidatus Latescibacterota bacterium]
MGKAQNGRTAPAGPELIQALASASQKLGFALFIKDREGKYLYANRPYRDIAGLKREEVVGLTDEDLSISVFPGDAERRVQGGEELRVSVPADGEEENGAFNFALEPVYSHDGRIEGIAGVGMIADTGTSISSELLRSRDVEEARVILSSVAHDLNNYLYGVSGVAALALEATDDDKSVSSDLKEILEISGKIGDYIKRMQDITNQKIGDRNRESLNDIIRGIESYLRKEFPEGITVRTELPGEDCFVMVEREKIENAILNICYNAREAIEEQGEITLKLTGVVKMLGEREQKYYRVVVEDSGCGMGAEQKEKCLELFYSTWKKGSSVGLGLPVAESIIKRHHGELSVNTSPGSGTSVEILLPAG